MSQIVLRGRIPPEEPLAPGHVACPGCGGSIAVRLVLKAIGPRTVVTLPPACWASTAGPQPQSVLGVPVLHMATGATVAAASGIRAALDARGDTETSVLAWTDDGGPPGLGLQALTAAVERNEDILFVYCDPEAGGSYHPRHSTVGSGTGRSPATAKSAPGSFPEEDMVSTLAARRIPYAATSTVAHPLDLVEKVQRARAIRGAKFLHILAPCPPGWQVPEAETLDLARQAVRTRAFPLFEVEDGRRWRLTVDHPGDPVEPFIRRQGRFRHLTPEEVRQIQAAVDAHWESLKRRVESGG